MKNKPYNAKKYWESILESDFKCFSVGFVCFGKKYNDYLYKMKERSLKRVISRYKIKNLNEKNILDIGCGTGFYVNIWDKLNVKHLTGIDITSISAKRLTIQYPDYFFYEADIGSQNLFDEVPLVKNNFDIITAFDVLFHIIDDDKFEQAIKNLHCLCANGGMVLITDLFLHKTPYILYFQKCRILSEYMQLLTKNGFEIVGRHPVHFLAAAPLDISNFLLRRVLLRSWWKAIAIFERKTHFLGPILFILDLMLTKLFKESPTVEMLVCKRS